MKKLYIVLAVLLSFGVMKAFADNEINTPFSRTNSIPADYGGVDVATNSFYVGHATVPTENSARGNSYLKFSTTNVNGVVAQARWTIYGVNFSTGLCSNADFVAIYVSTSGIPQARELTRFYNSVSIATSPTAGSNTCAGVTPLRWPIRAYGNLFFGVNVPAIGVPTASNGNPYNRADLLYFREPD